MAPVSLPKPVPAASTIQRSEENLTPISPNKAQAARAAGLSSPSKQTDRKLTASPQGSFSLDDAKAREQWFAIYRSDAKRKSEETGSPKKQAVSDSGPPQKLRKLHEQDPSSFKWRGECFALDTAAFGADSRMAKIAETQPNVIPLIPNDQILHKKVDPNLVTDICAQFQKVHECAIPVAHIYNLSNAIFDKDCDFLLVENVPHPFPMWNSHALISRLTDEQKGALKELRHLFQQTYQFSLDVDLCPSNLRKRESGQLTLLHVGEQKIETDRDSRFLDMFKNFAEPGSQIWTFLTDSVVFSDRIRNYGR